jgi:hypothetical protein
VWFFLCRTEHGERLELRMGLDEDDVKFTMSLAIDGSFLYSDRIQDVTKL